LGMGTIFQESAIKKAYLIQGKREDVDTDGVETLRIGTEETLVYPKYCMRYGNCQQCDIEGKIYCAPRFRD